MKEYLVNKDLWDKQIEATSNHYLNLGSGFDAHMKGWFKSADFDNQCVIYGFETQSWQVNERNEIHGGVIAGMFDTSMGTVANFIAGENESTTVDFTVSFIRTLPLGAEVEVKNYVVKAGRRAIRIRGEMYDISNGKLIATSSGTWMPL